MKATIEILKKYWGYASFRPLQEDIINDVIAGKDVLALMPTGGGKSITYQVPALVLNGVCIVVSPLIALIKDQVEDLRSRELNAHYIVSGMDYSEIDRILDNCIYGDVDFLYVSPERLKNELFLERFKQMKVAMIAVDEAHCISQWGYDFRPSYLQIADIRSLHPNVPLLALTASATPDVVEDIQHRLAFSKPNLLSTSFKRENLHYVLIKEENKRERILKGLQARPGSGIIYVRSRKLTRELTAWLKHAGISAAAYHAGLDPEHKDKIQAQWKNEELRIMVATNAFGMGIDKANVRTVIHYELPDSIEAYFQEAGRAGRDGLSAYAIMLYDDSDKRLVKEKIENSFPSIEVIKSVYAGIANFYKLAHGSGMHQNFAFDIIAISERTGLSVLDVFNSIKILERSGYYQLSDSLHKPSRLKIKVSNADLYYFEVANPKFEKLLKTLLRSYSGLFDSFININEHLVAKRLSIDVRELMEQLLYLNKIEVIEYLPANDKPQITFLHERLPEDRIRIEYESYGALKKRQLARCDAMLEYIETDRCRSVQLLEYFGEKNAEECGRCDVCIGSTSGVSEIELKLKELLKTKEVSLDTILRELKVKNEKTIIDLLRKFSDEGLVSKGNNESWKWN